MDKNSEHLSNIVSAIVATGRLEETNWAEFSVVFEFNRTGELNGTYGYAYGSNKEWNAVSFKPRTIGTAVNAYEQFLRPEGDKPMVKMLFQFNRDSGRCHVDFEYEDSSRWQVKPANIQEIIQELKPNLN